MNSGSASRMRRSKSSSHIPVATNDQRSRARSSVRTSGSNPSNPKTRPPSMERLAVPGLRRSASLQRLSYKTSVSATPLDGRMFGGKKSSMTPTILGSGLRRVNSINFTPTPSSSSSRSPYKFPTDWNVNSKEWVLQQSAKLLRFLQSLPHCDEHITSLLKPPITINSFVLVMDMLVRELNPRVQITTANYKETVPSVLKIFHYPGEIKGSVLKTVNTKHSWPQVVCIFSFFMELILATKKVDLPVPEKLEKDIKYRKFECVTNYIVERYMLYNKNLDQGIADTQFKEEFGKILNADEEERQRLQNEVSSLAKHKEKLKKDLDQQLAHNEHVTKETEKLQNEIDTFYYNREQQRDDIACSRNLLQARKEKLMTLIKSKRDNISSLTETIKKQPCTVDERKRMLEHIAQLKHAIELKNEELRDKRAIKEQHEFNLAEAKKKIETEVSRINRSLMKPALLEPELKSLHLKETDVLSKEFADEVQVLDKNIKDFETKFTKEIETLKFSNIELKAKISKQQLQTETVNKELQFVTESQSAVTAEIKEIGREVENAYKEREEQASVFQQKMKQLQEGWPNLTELRQELQKTQETKNLREMALESQKKRQIEFFVKLREITLDSLVEKNRIHTAVVDQLTGGLNNIENVQEAVIEDVQKLEELQE